MTATQFNTWASAQDEVMCLGKRWLCPTKNFIFWQRVISHKAGQDLKTTESTSWKNICHYEQKAIGLTGQLGRLVGTEREACFHSHTNSTVTKRHTRSHRLTQGSHSSDFIKTIWIWKAVCYNAFFNESEEMRNNLNVQKTVEELSKWWHPPNEILQRH